MTPIPKARLWTGHIFSTLIAVFLLVSGVNVVFVHSPDVMASFAKFGYPESMFVPIGITEFVCAALYIIPQTSVFGAILLTAYLGGATATHIRISDPTGVAAPLVGILVWVGLYLRDDRLWALVPLRKKP